jgi:hypothetical protein
MATTTSPPTETQKDRFSISKFISRMRSKRASPKNSQAPGQTKDTRPPLNWAPLPLVLPDHQPLLSNLGWTPVTFPDPHTSLEPHDTNGHVDQHLPPAPGLHPLQKAYQDLFAAARIFFDSPVEEKKKWVIDTDTEEGWFCVPGEKEFFTLRTLKNTPDVLKEPAERYWQLVGAYLDSCLGRISTALGLPDGEEEGLRRYVGLCKVLGEEEDERRGALLRLFRYENGGDAQSGRERVVAEPHADLGLLSFVVGDVPGLEVWNGKEFVDVERRYVGEKRTCGTLLAGRQLERLANWRVPAGGHRVVSYGATMSPHFDPDSDQDSTVRSSLDAMALVPRHRFSIVFVLRAHHPVIVNSDALTTPITGEWEKPIKDMDVQTWYNEIRAAHWNVNTKRDVREGQKAKVLKAKGEGEKVGDGVGGGKA